MDYGERLKSYLESTAFQERAREGARLPQPFVTISRQAGAGGLTLAEAIQKEMDRDADPLLRGWNILDKDLCEEVAADRKLSVSMDALMKETFRTEFEDYVMQFVTDESPQAAVTAKVFKTLRAAAAAGKVIIVGRAANCVTRRLPLGVHVRLVASKTWRQGHLMKLLKIGRTDGERHMEALDASRRRLVDQYFHRDIDDPLLYDATWNVETVPCETLARLTVELVRRKKVALQQTA
jgi:cytidylate kinase